MDYAVLVGTIFLYVTCYDIICLQLVSSVYSKWVHVFFQHRTLYDVIHSREVLCECITLILYSFGAVHTACLLHWYSHHHSVRLHLWWRKLKMLHGMSRHMTTWPLPCMRPPLIELDLKASRGNADNVTGCLRPCSLLQQVVPFFSKQWSNSEVFLWSSVTGTEIEVKLQKSHLRMDKMSLRRRLCGRRNNSYTLVIFF